MNLGSIKLKDIAKELNISVTTVSKALKDYPDISKETKDRVRLLVQKWNYVPNFHASNLRTKRTNTIGVIIPEVVHHFFSQVVSGIMEECESRNFVPILLQSNEKFETENNQINLLKKYQVDGVLLSLSNETEETEHLDEIKKLGTKVVLFDKVDWNFKCSKVIIDDYDAAYNATEHLIRTGCKNIAHIAGPLIPRNAKDRLKGYRDALIKNGFDFNTDKVYRTHDSTFEEGYAQAMKILTQHPKTDGVFCVTDMLAIGAMAAIKDKCLKIPNDISVIGFSDWFMASVVSPSLTTIKQPGYEMGKEAARLLIEEIEFPHEENYTFKKVIIPTELIIRNSTK